jgi:polypeptide N-acetylgalactosaminyltransferase
MTWGGFNWHMNFRWYTVPKRELDRRKGDRSVPIRTPTIAGGLFSIDKSYFYELGSYDEGMHVWGGENLEISFRVWQCGGTLEIATCSHVGHVFRKQTPYTFPGGTAFVIHHNAARTVEVWMDDYKKFFYKMTPGARAVDLGNVTDRRAIRDRLKCKSFKWYLENIYPESPIPTEYHSLGQIESSMDKMCLDTMGRKEGQFAGLVKCHNMGGNQAWSYTALGELRADELCLEGGGGFGSAKLQKCHRLQGNQLWTYDAATKQLRHVSSNQCLAAKGETAALVACDSNNQLQTWILEDFTPTARPASK